MLCDCILIASFLHLNCFLIYLLYSEVYSLYLLPLHYKLVFFVSLLAISYFDSTYFYPLLSCMFLRFYLDECSVIW